ncbi:MAG: YvcK family protein [Coriobacteriales bacterium]|jgi:uncharacterized cofD-like protein|nr:YvcK family protein [Coriobacteriales bacterium]
MSRRKDGFATAVRGRSRSEIRAVVIGGGTGAPVSIRALLNLGVQTSAVVAMADDGGSTGMLRDHAGIVPPGDIRKCLIAMAQDPKDTWVKAFRQRFSYVNDHTLGNLMLTALTEASGSFPEAIALCGQLLKARGMVYPSTLESVKLTGRTRDGRHINGQANICVSDTALASVSLEPSWPQAYEPALAALRRADLIVLGPGSLFTSIIPSLLVPGVLDAIRKSSGIKVFLCSLADMQGETWGLNSAELVEALLDHGMRGLLDVVVLHQQSGQRTPGSVTASFAAIDPNMAPLASDNSPAKGSVRRVHFNQELAQRIESQGPLLVVRDLVDPLRPTWHEVSVLSEVLGGVLDACPLQRK